MNSIKLSVSLCLCGDVMIVAADVVAAAQSWVGVPWRHQGRSREGVDCLGLLIVVARDLGIDRGIDLDAPAFRAYRRLPPAGLAGKLAEHLDRATIIEPGTIGLFALAETQPAHVGIFAPGPGSGLDLIHAYAPAKAVVRHRLTDDWRQNLRALFSYRGVAGRYGG